MSPEERAAIEKQIERHLKRGDVFEACVQLQALVEAFPGEAALSERLIHLEGSLDPTERRRVSLIKPDSTGNHRSPVSQAEALAATGKYREAIELYRGLLAERPDWELVRERITELELLQQLAHPHEPPPPTRDEKTESVLEGLLDRISTRKR